MWLQLICRYMGYTKYVYLDVKYKTASILFVNGAFATRRSTVLWYAFVQRSV